MYFKLVQPLRLFPSLRVTQNNTDAELNNTWVFLSLKYFVVKGRGGGVNYRWNRYLVKSLYRVKSFFPLKKITLDYKYSDKHFRMLKLER